MYENRNVQSFVKNYFNQHEYMKDKDPNQVTSILVFDYLVQNGYESVALKLATDILKSQEMSESESDESDEEESKLTDPDRVAFTLVSDYLNQFGYQGLAQELQNQVNFSRIDLQGLDLLSVIKSRLVQVPEDQQSTRKRKLDNCDKNETKVEPRQKKAKQDLEPGQFEDDELNRLVPIRNVFIDKVALLNIISMSDTVRKGFRVTINTLIDDCFYVTNKRTGVSI